MLQKSFPLNVLPAILPFQFPAISQVKVYFTTALYGNISLDSGLISSAVAGRRLALAPLLGFSSWTELHQVHGDNILIEPEPTSFDTPSTLEADGAMTSIAGRALVSKAADCQQILIADKGGRHIAALHCGWRGNRINFPGTAVKFFCETYGVTPCDIMAVRGPSLGPSMAEFINFDQEWGADFSRWFNPETKMMDLWSLTRHQLLSAGLSSDNIFGIDLCTFTFHDFLFSHRRGHTGRQAAVIFIDT